MRTALCIFVENLQFTAIIDTSRSIPGNVAAYSKE